MDDNNAVAVIGIGCRFPGAENIDDFFKVLENGECNVHRVHEERWVPEEVDIRNEDATWKDCARHAGLIENYDRFDNKLFGISDLEASWMDPQQCMALEVTYSAIENAGFTRDQIKGSKTGVYIGIMNDDLSLGISNAKDEFNPFLVTGIAKSITANRISHFYDIRGPSMVVDTACSSALVAVHLGCQAIRSGECEMAICGGSNSILTPVNFIALSQASMISPTGQSYAFSNKADGYVRGEGCGMVILKNYKKALEDGDNVWCTISIGCNQNGQSSTPITSPSKSQQLALLTEVYTKYGVDPRDIQYIEAHGTGTKVGDPIEFNALSAFFKQRVSPRDKIPIGSVKTNIGHLESSAGTAGLIKVMLMMKYAKITPSLHYENGQGNEHINFESSPLSVSTRISKWDANGKGSRLACVNSFGFGGTNSHAIVWKKEDSQPAVSDKLESYVICLSASNMRSLKEMTEHFQQKISTEKYEIQDLSYTSLVHRHHFKYRKIFVADTTEDLQKEINKFESLKENPLPVVSGKHNLIFLFCGVGTIWKGTCKAMLKRNAIFKKKFEAVDRELKKFTDLSLIDVVEKSDDDLEKNSFRGPLIIFACQVSLFHFWIELGIRPQIIIGQSVGEVAATYAAGCITFQDAVKIIYYRSYFTAQTKDGQMMVILKCNISAIENLCEQTNGNVCMAVYSSREACVVSGSNQEVANLKKLIKKKYPSAITKLLSVNCAYHSRFMDEAARQIEEKLEGIRGYSPTTRIISTVCGTEVTNTRMGTKTYWSENLRNPVRLTSAVSCALRDNMSNIILEVGPKPVIRTHVKNITDLPVAVIPSMDKPDEKRTLMTAVGEFCRLGYVQNFKKVIFNGKERKTDIPRYEFNRTGVLLKSAALKEGLRGTISSFNNHKFVYRKAMSSDFKIDLSPTTTRFVYEHFISGRQIAPGATFAEIGLVAAKHMSPEQLSNICISLTFVKPLRVGSQPVSLEALLNENNHSVEIRRNQDTLCKINLEKVTVKSLPNDIDIEELRQRCNIHVSRKAFYSSLEMLGFKYGTSLTIIENSWRSQNEYLSELKYDPRKHGSSKNMCLHPAIIDGALQTIVLCYLAKQEHEGNSSFENDRPMPVRLRFLTVRRQPEENMLVFGQLVRTSSAGSEMNVFVLSANGEIIIEIEGYEVQNLAPGITSTRTLEDKFYKLDWNLLETKQHDKWSDQTVCCITFNEKGADIIKKHFGHSNTKVVVIQFESEADIWSRLSKEIRVLFNNFEHTHAILYFPNLSNKYSNSSPKQIFNMVKTSCVVLTFLIQLLCKDKKDIPFYVLTRQTQPKANLFSKKRDTNVIGPELWGHGRCLVRERIFSKFYLIDYEENHDISLLKSIILETREDDKEISSPEYKLQDGRIFINQINRCPASKPMARECRYINRTSGMLELRSRSLDNINNPFFVQVPEESPHSQNECVRLKVRNAFFDGSWFRAKESAIQDTDPFKRMHRMGFQIIATEVVGKVVDQSNSCKEKGAPSEIKHTSNESSDRSIVVTCLPSICSTYVVIPESCTIPILLLQPYRPYLLIEMVLLHYIVERCERNTSLAILYDKDIRLDDKLVDKLSKPFNLRIIQFKDETDLPTLDKGDTLLLLTRKFAKISGVLLNLKDVVKVITLSNFVSKNLESSIRLSKPMHYFTVINTDDVLSQHKLSQSIECLKKILKSRHRTSTKLSQVFVSEKIKEICFENEKVTERALSAIGLAVETSEMNLFSKSGIYVVIGGWTGLGWEIVNKIVQMGGGVVIIISRHSRRDTCLKEINLLVSQYKCIIDSYTADISVKAEVEQAFHSIKQKFSIYSIRGIFHGAAVVDDALIINMTEEKIDRVLRPKVLGTWNLHLISKDLPLDFFVLHSSISSAFGNSGQTNYGAGNAFKDAVAHFRRSIGLPGQTINWGALGLGILKDHEKVEKHLMSQGFITLDKDEIMDSLIYALLKDDVQVICANFDWKTVIRQSPDMLHLMTRLKPILIEYDEFKKQKVLKADIESIDRQDLLKLKPKEQIGKISDLVMTITANVCAVEKSDLNATSEFTRLGMDSMKGMAFINAIYEHISCKIQIVAVLDDNSSVKTVTDLIHEQVVAGNKNEGHSILEEN